MSRSICLFYEQELLYEQHIPKDPFISNLISSSDNIQRLIDLSKKYFTSSGLTKDEYKESQELFKDPKVERILNAAEKVGTRNGWISGGSFGLIFGSLVGGGLTLSGAGPFFALVLIGAIMGGLSIGYVTSKIVGILTRWKAEENISSGGGVRVHT